MILKLDIGTLEENLCETYPEENVIKNGYINFLKTIKAIKWICNERNLKESGSRPYSFKNDYNMYWRQY